MVTRKNKNYSLHFIFFIECFFLEIEEIGFDLNHYFRGKKNFEEFIFK